MAGLFDKIPLIDVDTLRAAIEDPVGHMTVAALMMALAVGTLLVVCLLVLLALGIPSSRREGPQPVERPSVRPRRLGMRVDAIAAVAVAICLGLLTGVWWVRGTSDEACLSCHEKTVEANGAHASVGCRECHEAQGFLGIPENVLRRAHMQFARGGSLVRRASVQPDVPDARCVRCHRDGLDGDGGGPVRMSHQEVGAAGMTCISCHGSAGSHETAEGAAAHPSMSTCLGCHDGTRASVACPTCHVGEPADAARAKKLPIMKVRLEKDRDCRGCHSMQSCIECHGLELPHPAAFRRGDHRRVAAFDGKSRRCYRCHSELWCANTCHDRAPGKPQVWGHQPDWKAAHATADPRTCTTCHSTAQTCASCH